MYNPNVKTMDFSEMAKGLEELKALGFEEKESCRIYKTLETADGKWKIEIDLTGGQRSVLAIYELEGGKWSWWCTGFYQTYAGFNEGAAKKAKRFMGLGNEEPEGIVINTGLRYAG